MKHYLCLCRRLKTPRLFHHLALNYFNLLDKGSVSCILPRREISHLFPELNIDKSKMEMDHAGTKTFSDCANLEDYEFNKIGDEFKEIQNYILLSFLCLIRYQVTSDLKYLNTFLKLNDTICSVKNLVVNKIDISLFHFLLMSEMKYVLKLLDGLGIWSE